MFTETKGSGVSRRALLGAAVAIPVGTFLFYFNRNRSSGGRTTSAEPKVSADSLSSVTIAEFTDTGEPKGIVSVPAMQKTEAEWKKQLSLNSFYVTRMADTELPFSGELLNVHDKGVFRCICCDTALFDSATKFDSGTGWPSFWQPIAKENVVETTDNTFGMKRTAVSCRRCDAHLGHVFDDGPKPTGLRYCMNSVAMRFAKA